MRRVVKCAFNGSKRSQIVKRATKFCEGYPVYETDKDKKCHNKYDCEKEAWCSEVTPVLLEKSARK